MRTNYNEIYSIIECKRIHLFATFETVPMLINCNVNRNVHARQPECFKLLFYIEPIFPVLIALAYITTQLCIYILFLNCSPSAVCVYTYRLCVCACMCSLRKFQTVNRNSRGERQGLPYQFFIGFLFIMIAYICKGLGHCPLHRGRAEHVCTSCLTSSPTQTPTKSTTLFSASSVSRLCVQSKSYHKPKVL